MIRSIARVLPAFSVSLLLLAQEPNRAPAQDSMMDEPLFGISYSIAKVHFDDAPASIKRLCQWNDRMWLYASWKEADKEYFLVNDLVRTRPDGGGKQPPGYEPGFGSVVELHGTECAIAPADTFMSGEVVSGKHIKPIQPSDAVIRGLVSDAFLRYTAAFGGKENFVREVHKVGASLADLPPILRSEFERFAKTP